MVLKGGRMETTVWAGKLLVVCVGIVSTMVFFKVVIIPYLLNLALSTLPHLWTSITASCCLSPLYIYIILNFIILIIAASSTLQKHPSNSSINNLNNAKTSTSTTDENDYDGTAECNSNKMESRHYENATISHLPSLLTHQFSNEMISWHDIHIIQQASTEFEEEQEEEEPGPIDPSPEVAASSAEESCLTEKPVTTIEEAEDNTLDTTWNAIMERQGKPICKHLKKSETWDTQPRTTGLVRSSIIPAREFLVDEFEEEDHYQETIIINSNDVVDHDRVEWARKELRKSETFSDRVSMIREKSMSQEELKQRAEAFINKINNQMRLQRLESDQRSRDMYG